MPDGFLTQLLTMTTTHKFPFLTGALVNIGFALPPREAGCALAFVRVDPVHTESAILARGGEAFVHVDFAGEALKTGLALTAEFTAKVAMGQPDW